MELIQNLKTKLFKENTITAQALGLCPALAVSSTAKNAFIMGLLTLIVLILSSCLVSVIRKMVPQHARIPIFIVIIAGFVSLVDIFMQGFFYENYKIIGLFIPLIVVNCAILANAETLASKTDLKDTFINSTFTGLGFIFSICLIGIFRELLSNMSIFGYKIVEGNGLLIFLTPAGAFLALGIIMAIINYFTNKQKDIK